MFVRQFFDLFLKGRVEYSTLALTVPIYECLIRLNEKHVPTHIKFKNQRFGYKPFLENSHVLSYG